ncbi:hypothetical protein BRD17_04560 [Halobacteriales archaeon SW_7_68_16]|nr:MAG: hypothetical protein BRD17_04560 [Halobacteriales archaeon SW_7_68_16]
MRSERRVVVIVRERNRCGAEYPVSVARRSCHRHVSTASQGDTREASPFSMPAIDTEPTGVEPETDAGDVTPRSQVAAIIPAVTTDRAVATDHPSIRAADRKLGGFRRRPSGPPKPRI